MTAPAEQRSRRQSRPVVVLRPIPGRSTIHDLWAGTKFIAMLCFSVLLAVLPGWLPIGLVTLVLIVAVRAARVPRGALPSVPRWVWLILLITNLIPLFNGQSPTIHLGTVGVGIGGLLEVLRFSALSLVLLGLSAVTSWTTNVAEVPPAVATLGRPLRRFRVPVDEWAVAVGLALRAFPMLLEEFRMLYAARRLRPKGQPAVWWRRPLLWAADAVDVFAAALTVALRRGDEMGDAITSRGGTGQISAATTRLNKSDWVALGIVALTCAAAVLSELTLVSTT